MVKANWRDNAWFPSVLEEERELDLAKYPDRYHHVWEGEYVRAFEGAYFASVLSQARKEGRIGNPLRAFWDIGGAGAKADAMALDCAMSGAGIRVLDYLEGQVTTPTSYTIAATRKRSAICRMTGLCERGHSTQIQGPVRDAEFQVEVIPNQGSGAAAMLH